MNNKTFRSNRIISIKYNFIRENDPTKVRNEMNTQILHQRNTQNDRKEFQNELSIRKLENKFYRFYSGNCLLFNGKYMHVRYMGTICGDFK